MVETSESPKTRPTILVIDDTFDERRYMADKLRSVGYNLIDAQDGQSGQYLAQLGFPHLIILDLSMAGMDGFKVLDELRQKPSTAKVPVIVCSARCSQADILRAKNAGATNLIVKPFVFQTLLDRVSRVCPLPTSPPEKRDEQRPKEEVLESRGKNPADFSSNKGPEK